MGKKSVTPAEELERSTAETAQETTQETAEAMEASEAATAAEAEQGTAETAREEPPVPPESAGTEPKTVFFVNGQPIGSRVAAEFEPPQENQADAWDETEDQEEPWAAPPVTLAVVDAKRGLNLRAGPGKEFPVLAVLPDAALVEEIPLLANPSDEPAYLLQVFGWALVKPAASVGTAGWVDRNFLVPVPAYDGDDR